MVYLPKGVHLKKLRGLVGDTHLKILCQLNLNPTVFCSNKCLEGILVTRSRMQYLCNKNRLGIDKLELRTCVSEWC